MAGKNLKKAPAQPNNDVLLKAHLIIEYAHDTGQAFLEAFKTVRIARGAGSGATTHVDQDLLRAMVVFAASGLDSMIKQIVRDLAPSLVVKDSDSRKSFKDFVARKLKRGEDASEFLSAIMIEDSPKEALIKNLISEFTSSSLQSIEELRRVAKFFGIPHKEVIGDEPLLRKAFEAEKELRKQVIEQLIAVNLQLVKKKGL